jgi:hypothetical protein
MRPAYDIHQLVLQTLQHGRQPRTWVLKSPGHLAYLELILALYPDARVVVCHRDPLAMLSSVTSLAATLRWGHANHVDYQALAREHAELLGRNLSHLLELRTRGVITDAQVVDVRFDEFVADQVGTIERIAGHFALPFDPGPLAAHLAAKPRGRHGDHDHAFAALGLDADAERARFGEYMSYFAIRPEPIG